MGLIQLGVGFLKLGKFIRLVPHPVVYGFVNGLAIVIFMSQLNEFKVASGPNAGEWITGPALYLMLGLVLATMAIIYFLPRFGMSTFLGTYLLKPKNVYYYFL